jgi:hypothetical protein
VEAREHALLAFTVGVKQMICCCNKVFLLNFKVFLLNFKVFLLNFKVFLLIFISTLFLLCNLQIIHCFAPLFIWTFIMNIIKRSWSSVPCKVRGYFLQC